MTKELSTKIIASIVFGIIIFYTMQRYLSKPKQDETLPTQQIATVVQNRITQPIETPISSKAPKQEVYNREPEMTKTTPSNLEEPQQQEVDAGKVEGQLQTMLKETRTKHDSLSKDNKMNEEAANTRKKADAAYDELENQPK